jgi:hypothetical protein
MRYTGPSKPVRLYRTPLIDKVEYIVFVLGLIVVCLDLYHWRPN